MRIYVPVLPSDRHALAGAAGPSPQLLLDPGRAAWAVTDEARADRPGEDVEDLEYDALQDAVYAALQEAEGEGTRVAVIAGDVPDPSAREQSATGGAFGVELPDGALLRVASLHVSELGAAAIRADDTDPALLWFDAAEAAAALDYCAREA